MRFSRFQRLDEQNVTPENKSNFMASGDEYFREYDYEKLYTDDKKLKCSDPTPFKIKDIVWASKE